MNNWEVALRQLCQAQPSVLMAWLHNDKSKLYLSLVFIIIGGMLYGGSLGIWRAPLQGIYVAIKFPLLLILTALGSALINGMLAQLLGAPIRFRQSLLAVLMSFALLAVILAAFAPLSLFLLYNLPSAGNLQQNFGYEVYLLTNTLVIAFAGIISNLSLYRLLKYLCPQPQQAKQILFSWLGVNLFLGAQLSWNLRPFFGSPKLPVHFLRDDPFAGSFFEALFNILRYSL
ncbi:hypothetical protein [Candidatus Venteria ishoeyi]|uniref:Actin-binding WH2 domain-containing protein n=1 Tax=Candidatus Venteria ishoeyi TaxID=1899563 RepID=A0A1H6FH95_9GAMM|nr:hypothetical protein [Candidatus Venteria ishoeyi]SEH09023.1 Uncharacterised protein [Candidatus Venteria ishoeyi]